MGLVLEEKTRRKIEDGKRAVFTLFAYSDDFHPDNDEGSYTCTVRIFNENSKLVGKYYRHFLVKDFNEKHYINFMKKFCYNYNYREQFNVKYDYMEKRNPNIIDEEIVEIVAELNKLGLKTKHSCQGTKDPWSDRPSKGDGHSVMSYISFENSLPDSFIQIAKECKYFYVNSHKIYSRKREDNPYFAENMREIIEQWRSSTIV